MLKSLRVVVVVVVVAWSNLVSAQGPLVLVLGLKGLGLRVWGQGLTIQIWFIGEGTLKTLRIRQYFLHSKKL